MPLPFDPKDILITPLSDDCQKEAFSCGDDTADLWLHGHSHKMHDKYECRVKSVRVDGQELPVAFYALSMKSVKHVHLGKLRLDHLFVTTHKQDFTALSLDWIMVRRDLRGNGFGRYLLGMVLEECYECIENYCLEAMVLEAIDQRTENFYHGMGFRRYGAPIKPQRRMVLGAKPIIQARIKLNKMLAEAEQQA